MASGFFEMGGPGVGVGGWGGVGGGHGMRMATYFSVHAHGTHSLFIAS